MLDGQRLGYYYCFKLLSRALLSITDANFNFLYLSITYEILWFVYHCSKAIVVQIAL